MSTKQLKEKIVAELEHTEDEVFLQEVLEMLRGRDLTVHTEVNEPVFKLSPGMRASIQRGLDDVAAGRVSTHEEVMREFDEWLDEEDKKWKGK